MIALVLITFSYSKIKEYTVLKDVFVFINENIVSILIVKKDDDIHDYDYLKIYYYIHIIIFAI